MTISGPVKRFTGTERLDIDPVKGLRMRVKTPQTPYFDPSAFGFDEGGYVQKMPEAMKQLRYAFLHPGSWPGFDPSIYPEEALELAVPEQYGLPLPSKEEYPDDYEPYWVKPLPAHVTRAKAPVSAVTGAPVDTSRMSAYRAYGEVHGEWGNLNPFFRAQQEQGIFGESRERLRPTPREKAIFGERLPLPPQPVTPVPPPIHITEIVTMTEALRDLYPDVKVGTRIATLSTGERIAVSESVAKQWTTQIWETMPDLGLPPGAIFVGRGKQGISYLPAGTIETLKIKPSAVIPKAAPAISKKAIEFPAIPIVPIIPPGTKAKLPSSYPVGADIEEVRDWLQTTVNALAFVKYLRSIGPTVGTVGLLVELNPDITQDEVNEIFAPPPINLVPGASPNEPPLAEAITAPPRVTIVPRPRVTIGPREELPSLTWLDKVKELSDNPAKLVPFVSSGVEIVTIGKLLKTALDWEAKREVSKEDLTALKDYVERTQRETDFGFKVADVVANLIPFAGEFIATGGIFAIGSRAAVKVSLEALKRVATKTGLKLLESKLAQFGVKVAGVVAGGTLRTIPAGITRIPAGTLSKQLQATLTGDEEAVWQSAVKALGEQWVEIVSESTGGLFAPLTASIKGQLLKLGVFKAFQKANPGQSVRNVRSVVERLGYHGVFNEMLEERVADVGHGILEPLGLSDQKFSIPSGQQLLVELVAFSIPGVAAKAAESVAGRIPLTERGAIEIPGEKPAKEPWQLTREEFLTYGKSVLPRAKGPKILEFPDGTSTGVMAGGDLILVRPGKHAVAIGKTELTAGSWDKQGLRPIEIDQYRKYFVQQALSEGKPVPAEVLKDYPDLAKAKSKAEVTPEYLAFLKTLEGKTPTDFSIKKEVGPVGPIYRIYDKSNNKEVGGMPSLKKAKDFLEKVLTQAAEQVKEAAPALEVEMAPSTAVQVGLPGLGKEAAQAQLFGEVSGKEARKVPLTKIPVRAAEISEAQARLEEEAEEAYEAQAQAEGLKAVLEIDPVANYRFQMGTKIVGRRKDKLGSGKVVPNMVGLDSLIPIREQEFPQYLTVKQAQALNPQADYSKYTRKGEKTYNKVPRDAALDSLATELGFTGTTASEDLANRVTQIRAEKRKIEEHLETIKTQMTERPLESVPEMTPAELSERQKIIGYAAGYETTLEQAEILAGVFAEYIMSENVVRAYEVKRALFAKTRAARAEQFKARMTELVVSEGMTVEAAFKQASQETLAGKLPTVSTDYLENTTEDMREALYLLVYNNAELQAYPLEMAATITALTNALTGTAIPRKKGTGSVLFPEGGSAWDRLNMVFGKQPRLVKALEKMADEGKSLKDVVEGVFREAGREPIPIDQEMADYLRSLANIPFGYKTTFEPPFEYPRVTDLRTEADLQFAKAELELGSKFAKGELTLDQYQLARIEARDKAYPPKPVTRFDAPIEATFKKPAFKGWTLGEKQVIVRVLKEAGLNLIDIGNLIRANVASFDNSFLRQSKVLATGHPLIGAAGHQAAWQSMFSQKHAEAEWQLIIRDPDYAIYEEVRARSEADPLRVPALANEKGTARYRRAEEYGFPGGERFIPRLTTKIPWIKLSERAFVAGTNKIVWGVWKTKLRLARRMAEKIASGEMKLKEGEAFDIVQEMIDHQKMLANLIQRASLGPLQGLAPVMSGVFFAARSKLGRWFFPLHLTGLSVQNKQVRFNPRVMREAWRDFFLMNAFWGGLMFLGDWLDLWETEDDPRNAEFMSARIGKIRIDPWAGYRQFAVLYARLVTGTGISSVTGAEYEVKKLGTLENFFRSSLSPMFSTLVDFWTGRNFLGQVVEITNGRQWLKRVMPFLISDVWEAYEEEGTKGAAIAIVPGIYGEGVQSYTGDWEDNFTKLGLPKYLENTANGIFDPRYDTADFWKDTSDDFKDVDPATLTEAKGFPKHIRHIAETRVIKEYLETLPGQTLASIPADPEKGLTFIDYYKQWKERQKLVAAGDKAVLTRREVQPDGTYKEVTYKGKKAVDIFDNDERTSKANLGNMTQRQFSLLNEYWLIDDIRERAEFLKKYKAEIGVKPREEHLRTHPGDNASLALWGQTKKVYSSKAYDEIQKLAKEFGIPDSALPDFGLPPEEETRDAYFKYQDVVDKFGMSSAEAHLFLLKDEKLDKFLYPNAERLPVPAWQGKPIPALEIEVKNRDLDDKFAVLTSKKEEATFKADPANKPWLEDKVRIGVYKKQYAFDNTVADKKMVELFVQYEPLPSGDESTLYRVNNPEFDQWGQKVYGWKPLDVKSVDALRLNVKNKEKDKQYGDIVGIGEREDFLNADTEYSLDRFRVEGYKKGLPDSVINQYAEYKEKMRTGQFKGSPYDDEWFLLEHPDLYAAMFTAEGAAWRRDFSKVPTRTVWTLYRAYQRLPDNELSREAFRLAYPNLDAWLILAKGANPLRVPNPRSTQWVNEAKARQPALAKPKPKETLPSRGRVGPSSARSTLSLLKRQGILR